MTKTANTNYGAGWSYAGADGDAFDRVDVSGPAQSLDEHDHSSGKGLAVVLTTASNELSGDVDMTNADTFYAGPSVSLTAGTWLVIGTLTIGGTGIVAACGARLSTLNGVIVYATATGTHPADAGSRTSITVSGIVVLAATTTIYLYGVSNSAGDDMDASAYSGTLACHLRAVRIA